MTGSTGCVRCACLSASLLAAALILPRVALAEDFYKGKQINFVVSSDVGGSYDAFARMLARYMPKYIPGQPSIVVQNMAGAGGLRATNWLYNVAPKDGLSIGMINNTPNTNERTTISGKSCHTSGRNRRNPAAATAIASRLRFTMF